MTHPIGAGTCNVPINMTVEERGILGRLAFALEMSTSEYIRRMIRLGIAFHHPTEAKSLATARRMRMAKAGALLAIGLLMVVGEMVSPSLDMACARRGRRSDDSIAMEVES